MSTHTFVINLTRFGDLLQTQPVLSGLKRSGQHTSLICLDTFQGVAGLLNDVDQVIALPGARLLALLDQGWPQALAYLQAWLEQCAQGHADQILNLTPTLSGRLLGRALGADTRGFGLDSFGFGVYSSPWAGFLQAASKYRGCSPFNLVDLFQRVAGLAPGSFRLRQPGPQARQRAQPLLGAAQKLAAFQLGASQDYRRWPVDFFVRAGQILWRETGLIPVLLGTEAEARLGQEFARGASYPFINLIGQTDIKTLAAVLECMDFLLTNDTGTMHLAAGLEVPVVAVFLATAQPFDTGPYLAGSISLEPDLPCHPCTFGQQCPHGLACRQQIKPEAVGSLLVSFARTSHWVVPSDLGARVWQARRDEHGFMDLCELGTASVSNRGLWVQVQRQVYRQFLDLAAEIETCVPEWPDVTFQQTLGRDLHHGLMLLTVVEEQARLLLRGAPPSIQKKFLANCQNFQDFLDKSSGFGVLAPMWMYQSQDAARSMEGFVALCGRYRDLFLAFVRSVGINLD